MTRISNLPGPRRVRGRLTRVCLVWLALQGAAAGAANATTFYMSPTGSDGASGLAASAPLATFGAAFSKIQRGDTLVLLDGVYHQQLFPSVPAVNPLNPLYITVRAQNEGQAIIDGDGVRIPVNLDDYTQGNYMIFEGLVARNGPDTVWYIRKDHVIIRRCSGYTANPDTNSEIFLVWATSDVLIEDSISSGTSRKQFLAFQAQRVTLRRNFAMPIRWDGRRFCGVWWPYTSSFELYQTSESLIENNIAYARADAFHFYLKTDGPATSNDRFLGNMALLAGKEPNGTMHVNPGTRPQGGDNCTYVADWTAQAEYRAGFVAYPGGPLDNHVYQDNLSYGNASVALTISCCSTFTNGTLRRMTAMGNGLGNPPNAGGPALHADILQTELNKFTTVEDNKIERVAGSNYAVTSLTGGGARLRYRYVDGIVRDGTTGGTAQGLWPWPMEARVQSELGVSPTNLIAAILPDQVVAVPVSGAPGAPTNLRVLR